LSIDISCTRIHAYIHAWLGSVASLTYIFLLLGLGRSKESNNKLLKPLENDGEDDSKKKEEKGEDDNIED
jgi:hypothetical protein